MSGRDGQKRDSASSRILLTLGLLAASVIAAWWVAHIVPVTVTSDAELHDVVFGWPIPWYHQDLSDYGGFVYPVDLTVYGDRARPVPVDVDRVPFGLDIVFFALVFWGLWRLLLLVLATRERRRAISERDAV